MYGKRLIIPISCCIAENNDDHDIREKILTSFVEVDMI